MYQRNVKGKMEKVKLCIAKYPLLCIIFAEPRTPLLYYVD